LPRAGDGGVVSVAIPTLNGGKCLERTLKAVSAQRLPSTCSLEIVVCDSGSRDGTVASARRHGAEVIEIASEQFSHGGTRNLLMEHARGDHVAFLTQDAVPADDRWLANMLSGFSLADNVGLVFGPYRPRPGASPMVARELGDWFRSFSPDGQPRIDRLEPAERAVSARALMGPRAFFTDANGCIEREAWRSIPYRPVRYAEDHVLAVDMLRAGYAKVYLPSAPVIHSHEYSTWGWMRRAFDEARAMRDVYGWVPTPRASARNLRGKVMADWRWVRRTRAASAREQGSVLIASLAHHGARAAGELLGSRAERLPTRMTATLSLEGR
jgi:rhamnosyltransferase